MKSQFYYLNKIYIYLFKYWPLHRVLNVEMTDPFRVFRLLNVTPSLKRRFFPVVVVFLSDVEYKEIK